MILLRLNSPRIARVCANCGKSFRGSRLARYCSQRCKQQDYRARKAQKQAESIVDHPAGIR